MILFDFKKKRFLNFCQRGKVFRFYDINILSKGVPFMNKNELISNMSKRSGLTKTDSAKALDAFIYNIVNSLKYGNEVRLVGITFMITLKSYQKGTKAYHT